MNAENWKKLEENFSEDGVVGGSLLEVMGHEKNYSTFVVNDFNWYLVLAESFQAYLLQTLRIAESRYRAVFATSPEQYYCETLLLHSVNFRSVRAAERVFLQGYPLSGFSLLRDVKDRALFLGAMSAGFTSYSKVFGSDQVDEKLKSDPKAYRRHVRNRRKREQTRVLDFMLRKNSGLPQEHLAELEQWEDLFHIEVHGARLTTSTDTFRWVSEPSELPLLPDFDPKSKSVLMYINRSLEINWMLLRTLPFLQLGERAFGPEWSKKWWILDESFKEAIQIGKKIASAITHLLQVKFPFSPEITYYTEPSV
jgi:hypothetical protein